MSTTARLVIEIGADPGGLRRDLARTEGILRDFARSSSGALSHTNLFGNLDSQGKRAATGLLRALNLEFASGLAETREKFANGVISASQFQRDGRRAAQAFNAGLRQGMQNLTSQGLIDVKVHAGLVSQFKASGLDAAQSFNAQLKTLGQGISSVGRTLSAAVTLPLVAGFTGVAKTAGDFQQAMLQVQATTRASAEVVRILGDRARELSGAFTATDIAKGMLELARAGLSARQVYTALPGVIQLAVAAQLDMAQASVIAARGLVQFQLSADSLTHINDVLVTAANRTVTNVADLATAFSYAAGFSHKLGISLETTTGALALMSQAGVDGTRAGTSLVGILNRLANANAFPGMKRLALDTADATGKLRPLADIIQQIKDRGIAMSTVLNAFGPRAGIGMVALASQGSVALRDMEKALQDSGGTAERFANTQLEGLNGALRRLKAAAVELGIALGNSGVLEALTRLVKGFSDLLRGVSSADATNLKMVTTFAAVALAIGPVLVALGGLIRLLATVRTAMALTAVAAEATGGAVALGGLATLLLPGGILLVGLAALGALLFSAGQKAIASAQEIAAFRGELSLLTSEQADALSLSLQRDLAEAHRVTAEARTAAAEARQALRSNPENKVLGSAGAVSQGAVDDAVAAEKRIQQQIDLTNDTLRDRATLNRAAADAVLEVQSEMDGMDDGVGAALDRWKELKEQVADVSTTLAIARARQEDLTEPLAAAQQLYGHITALIGLWSPAFRRANIEVVQMQETLRVGIQKVLAEIASRPIDALAVRLRTLQAQITAQTSGEVGPKGGNLSESASSVLAIQTEIAAAIKSQGVITGQNLGVVARYIALLGTAHSEWVQIGRAIDAANQKQAAANKDILKAAKGGITTLVETLLSVGTAIQGILQGANAFDVLGDRAQRAISGVLALLQAIGQLEKAQKAAADAGQEFNLGSVAGITSMIGIIGAGIGLLSALTGGGPSPADELLAQNNEALLQLKGTIDKANQTANLQLAAQKAVAHPKAVLEGAFGKGGFGSGFDLPTINHNLQQFGLTFAQLNAIAKDNGINLLDKNGHVVAGALDQLAEALGIVLADLAKFGKTLQDQQSRIAAHNKIFNLPDSAAQSLGDTKSLLEDLAPAIFQTLFAGIDTTAAGGQAELQRRLQELFAQIEAGLLPPSALGDLTSLDDLITLLLGVDDALDTMAKNMVAFADTVDAQRARLDLQQALTGEAATPTTAIQHEIELLQQFAPALGAAFQNIDLASAEGRTALRASLQHLFDLVDQGLITQDQLGGLESVDQLIQIITAIIGPLNGLSDAVDNVTHAMQGVPEGFKLALRQFQAQESVSPFAPGDKPIPILPPQPPPIEIHDLMPPPLIELNDTLTRILDQFTTLAPITVDDTLSKALLEGTPSFDLLAGALGSIQPSMNRLADAFSLLGDPFGRPIPILPPVAASSAETRPAPGPSRDVPLNFGPISVVVNGAGKDPDQIARETLTELKRQARAALGKSSMWPNL